MVVLKRHIVLVVVFVVALALGSVASTMAGGDASAATRVAKHSNAPAYAKAGPYAAGVTTLDLPDRKVEVWYPADKKATKGAVPDVYDLTTKVPPAIAALLPAGSTATFATDGYRSIKASKKGPFPLVLMTHGASGYREELSYLATHLASWGFVVVSPDMLERGLAASLGSPPAVPRDEIDVMRDAVALVRAENDRVGGPLAGRVRKNKLAVIGQAAGGTGAIKFAGEPGVVTYIPISASGFDATSESHLPLGPIPSLWITAADDQLIPLANVQAGYNRASIPARMVTIDGAGDASMTDVCQIGGEGGLVGLAARANLPIPESLKNLATDGCTAPIATPTAVWPVIRHMVTAQLRNAFGIDKKPVGLDAKTAAQFAPVSVHYEERGGEPLMSWALFIVGLATLALGVNVLRPSRSLLGMGISFFAEWLVAELAHWTVLVLGAGVAVLVALGGLSAWPGWVGLAAAVVGFGLMLVELGFAWRSSPVVVRALEAAGLGSPEPFRGRKLRLLFPFYLGDRRVERIGDVAYADGAGRRHLADIYRSRGGVENAPVLLQIHGGAWLIGNKRQQGRPLMNRMAAAGWVCVAINYRLAPKAKMPAAIVDVKQALAWIHAHITEYGGDPSRIIVSGGSAGGHLAAMAALTVNDPEYQPGFEDAETSVIGCVPLYPPTDLLRLFELGHGILRRWTDRAAAWVFGASPAEDPTRDRHWSPIELVRPGLVPFLVVQGSGDNLVPVEQTRAFVETLRAVPDQQVVYLELPGAPHAFEVFHSLRAEAAASGIHRFCSSLIAQGMVRDIIADPALSAPAVPIDVEAR